MKTYITSDNAHAIKLLTGYFKDRGHIVKSSDTKNCLLYDSIMVMEPHLVVADESQLKDINLQHILEETPVVYIRENIDSVLPKALTNKIEEALKTLPAKLPVRPYADGSRTVIHDSSLNEYYTESRLHRPDCKKLNQGAAEHEKIALIQLVHAAKTNMPLAVDYLKNVEAIQPGLVQECMYRNLHGSWKIMWMRDQIMRYISFLAHFVPYVELQYLPRPQNIATKIDFIQNRPSDGGMYALLALHRIGYRTDLEEILTNTLCSQFHGQNDKMLFKEGIELAGLLMTMREVAMANLTVLGEMLNLDSQWYISRKNSRTYDRSEGIFFEFWNMPIMHHNVLNLHEIVREVVTGECRIIFPEGKAAEYSYARFLEIAAAPQACGSE